MSARSLIIAGIALLLSLPLAAQEPEKLASTLQNTKKALQAAKHENKLVQRKRRNLQKELGRLQKELVRIADKIRTQEKALLELEEGLAELKKDERAMINTLLSRHEEIAPLMQTMIQLSRVPPEIVVAMPGDFHETFRTAKVLGLTSAALSQNSQNIRDKLAEIRTLQAMVAENHRTIMAHKTSLERSQQTLETKIAARGRIHDQLQTREQIQTAELERLSTESSNVKDLLTRLEEHREAQKGSATAMSIVPQDKPAEKAPKTRSSSGQMALATVKGKISLPAEGKITSFYGDKTAEGDISRGIKLRTRKRAKVVAPFDGEVVYTGPFMAYGNLVILRHADGNHTLLAGLEQVASQAGQRVLKGEPVGEMGNTTQATELYLELRENNRPVDPVPWLDTQKQLARKP